MILFSIKKSFFDLWDHLLPSALINLGFIVLLAIPVSLPFPLSKVSTVLAMIVLVVGLLICFVYMGIVARITQKITDYEGLEWKDFPAALREMWPQSVVLGGIYILHVILLLIALPFYANIQHVLALAAIAFLFWASVIWLLASLFFLPVRTRLDTKTGKILKKCFILFFDNTGFAIAMGIGAVVIMAGSVVTALLIPGITGLFIWLQTGLKLRIYKYDYLEENPNADRRRIPWDALLVEDRVRVGKRSLKGMIFPWKE